MGREGQTNYAATKGGIISFTKSLAREVAKYKITVNAIAPGLIETQMTKKIQREVLKKAIQEIPVGRIGQPEEVAEAVLFLASERASFITGTVLNVTGGQI
jgi:3-oxoacyl-[acyl-carrier protein] reductase